MIKFQECDGCRTRPHHLTLCPQCVMLRQLVDEHNERQTGRSKDDEARTFKMGDRFLAVLGNTRFLCMLCMTARDTLKLVDLNSGNRMNDNDLSGAKTLQELEAASGFLLQRLPGPNDNTW